MIKKKFIPRKKVTVGKPFLTNRFIIFIRSQNNYRPKLVKNEAVDLEKNRLKVQKSKNRSCFQGKIIVISKSSNGVEIPI